MKKRNDLLKFKAIKHKYIDDSDGEATLILKVDMLDKLSAFAVPAQKVLNVSISINDT